MARGHAQGSGHRHSGMETEPGPASKHASKPAASVAFVPAVGLAPQL